MTGNELLNALLPSLLTWGWPRPNMVRIGVGYRVKRREDKGVSYAGTTHELPEVSRSIFYPRQDLQRESLLPNAANHLVQVEEGVQIGCRFYVAGKECPSILYFHGNGETVGDYDYIAPLYNQRGINLFVTDYRGYGFSGGSPTLTNFIADAHLILRSFCRVIEHGGFNERLFVMGRSLGSAPAIELALHYQGVVKGLIVESGTARGFSNGEKVSSVHIPALFIHGEYDELISVEQGKQLYRSAGTTQKVLLVIDDAGHNDLMLVGALPYFREIDCLVHGGVGEEG